MFSFSVSYFLLNLLCSVHANLQSLWDDFFGANTYQWKVWFTLNPYHARLGPPSFPTYLSFKNYKFKLFISSKTFLLSWSGIILIFFFNSCATSSCYLLKVFLLNWFSSSQSYELPLCKVKLWLWLFFTLLWGHFALPMFGLSIDVIIAIINDVILWNYYVVACFAISMRPCLRCFTSILSSLDKILCHFRYFLVWSWKSHILLISNVLED